MSTRLNPEEETPIFTVLWKHKTIMFLCVGTVLAIAFWYTFLTKPVWQAKATIVFPTQTATVLGSSGFAQQSGIVATLAGAPTSLKVYKGFLESERTLNYVSAQSGMSKRQLSDKRDIQEQPMESSLTIKVRSTDPERARNAVKLHLDALQEINEDVAQPLLTDDVKVLEEKASAQRQIVVNLEAQLLAFQKGARTAPSVSLSSASGESVVIADPARWRLQQRELEIELRKIDSSLQSASDSVADAALTGDLLPSHIPPAKKWRDRLVELEYQLKIKEIEYAPGSPEVRKLKQEVDATRTQLQNEVEAYVQAVQEKSLDPTSPNSEIPQLLTTRVGLDAQLRAVRRLANLAPSESVALSSIVRDLSTQTAVLQKVEQQYELAKIQADRDPNRWQVLDEPAVEDRPVNKSYAKNGALAIVIGLMIGAMVSFRREKIDSEDHVISLRKAA